MTISAKKIKIKRGYFGIFGTEPGCDQSRTNDKKQETFFRVENIIKVINKFFSNLRGILVFLSRVNYMCHFRCNCVNFGGFLQKLLGV